MKKFICVFLALSILICVFGGILFQPAKAVTVTVTVVVGAAVAFLAMCGITWVTTGMTAAQFTSYISDELDAWAMSKGTVVDHLINTAGIGVTIPGLLKLSNLVATNLKDFAQWLANKLSLSNTAIQNVYTQPTTIAGVAVSRFNVYTFTADGSGNTTTMTIGQSVVYACYGIESNDSYRVQLISDAPFTVISIGHDRNGNVLFTQQADAESNANGIYNSSKRFLISLQQQPPPFPYYAGDVYSMPGQLQNNSITSGYTLDVSTSILDFPNIGTDENVYIDVGALPGDTVEDVTDKVIENVIDGDQTADGEIAGDDPQITITGPVAVTGLDDVFPFCIPFDIYNLLRVLAAAPETPVFEWRFWIPHVCDETIEIDLSGFDTLAALLRTFEVGLFCLGLALMTKRLIWK